METGHEKRDDGYRSKQHLGIGKSFTKLQTNWTKVDFQAEEEFTGRGHQTQGLTGCKGILT